MLNDLKKMLGINNTEFDTIITMYINSALADLTQVGVNVGTTTPTVSDPLIYSAVCSYVMGNLDTTYGEMYMNTYALQKDSLRHYSEYSL